MIMIKGSGRGTAGWTGSIWPIPEAKADDDQGEPLGQHYLSNAGVLQRRRILWQSMVVIDTTRSAYNR